MKKKTLCFYIIFSISFLPIYASIGAKDINQKQDADFSVEDAKKIEEFEELLKKHSDVIKSIAFPFGEVNARYNKELPLLFEQLKQRYNGLSIQAKGIVSSNKRLINTIEVIKDFMNKMMSKHRGSIIELKTHNLFMQIELQASMLQWYWSILSDKNKEAIDIQKIVQKFSALKKSKEEYEKKSFEKGMNELWKKENTKNPLFHLEFARQIFHDTTDEFPPALAYQPYNTFADAADAAQALHFSNSQMREMRAKLVQGGKYTSEVIQWFEKNPDALCGQDEHGWTPYMQAAAQGHQEMLDSFMQIFIDTFFVNAAGYYRTFYEIPRPDRNEDFLCVIDFLDKLQPVDISQPVQGASWSRHYVVNSDCYRPFVCSLIDINIKKEDAEKTLAKLQKEGKVSLVGLKAYIFAKCMEVKSKTYPTITVIDSAQKYNQFLAQCAEHLQKRKVAVDRALQSSSPVGMAGACAAGAGKQSTGIIIKPVRDIVSSYIANDIPNAVIKKDDEQEDNCCIQ